MMNDSTLDADVLGPVTPNSDALSDLIARIGEGAADRDRDRILPFDAIKLVRQARLGAFRVPIGAGGGGASLVALFETIIALADADPNVTHIIRNHFAFVEKTLRSADDDPQRGWLKRVVKGKLIGAVFSELGTVTAGSGQHETILRAEGADYRVSGIKYYSTGAMYADYVAINAIDATGAPVTAVVPADREGLHLDDDWDGIGQRLTGTGTTRLVDVRVWRPEVIFHASHRGHRAPYQATFPQLYLTAIIAGILRTVTRDAKALLRRRGRNYYHATSEEPTQDPILHLLLGQIASHAYAAEAIVLNAAAALERAASSAKHGEVDQDLAQEASLRAAKAKVVVDELAIRTAGQIFDVGGASATKQSAQLDRHWRNIRTLASHNPDAYKARVIGAYELNGVELPKGAFF